MVSRVQQLFIGVLTALLLISNAFADTLKVSTERQQIEQGDIISLWVEADFQTLGKTLNDSALQQDFKILSRQRSNFYEFINGQQSAKTRWHLRLIAKKSGEVLIPALKLGDISSDPLKLYIQATQQNAQSGIAFLKADINQQKGYVQQQFLYTLRFYYRGKLLPGTGDISSLSFGDALADNLKDESVYSTVINGDTYTVHEWRYALFPQHSGELTIKGPLVTGVLSIDRHQKAISQQAPDITLQVEAAAGDQLSYNAKQPWLPAKSVLLKQDWQQHSDKIQVGDTLTRTITLQAFGLKSNQLPTIETKDGSSFKVYAQPAKREEDKLDKGIISRIQIEQNIVPTQSGKITIPAYSLNWFNTDTQHFETATLASKTFNIAASAAQPNYQAVAPQQTVTPKQSPIQATEDTTMLWPAISALFALAWLITLAMWWQARKHKVVINTLEEDKTETDVQLGFQQWCQAEDKIFYRHLRPYLQSRLGITHLQQLDRLQANILKEKIESFEQNMFAAEKTLDKSQIGKLKAEICNLLLQVKLPAEAKKTWTKNTELKKLYPS